MTISRSTIRDKICVTEIDRRSATEIIGVHLGTGVITAVRHAAGTIPSPTDIFTMFATTKRHTDRHKTGVQIEILIDYLRGRQTVRKTERQTCRQIDRHI